MLSRLQIEAVNAPVMVAKFNGVFGERTVGENLHPRKREIGLLQLNRTVRAGDKATCAA